MGQSGFIVVIQINNITINIISCIHNRKPTFATPVYTMEYDSAIKMNEIVPFATTQMDLEDIMLNLVLILEFKFV